MICRYQDSIEIYFIFYSNLLTFKYRLYIQNEPLENPSWDLLINILIQCSFKKYSEPSNKANEFVWRQMSSSELKTNELSWRYTFAWKPSPAASPPLPETNDIKNSWPHDLVTSYCFKTWAVRHLTFFIVSWKMSATVAVRTSQIRRIFYLYLCLLQQCFHMKLLGIPVVTPAI